MKRIWTIALLMIFLLTGCSKTAVPEIDEYTWTMDTIQSVNNNGQIIAHGPGSTAGAGDFAETGTEAPLEMFLICEAENGVLTITDQTNHKTYTGTYKTAGTSPESLTYEVTVDGTDGMATVAMTEYHNGDQVPTLVMRLGEWTIYFYALNK